MKFKTDFVTNSSSASFILYFASTDKNLDSFQDSFNRYLEEYIQEYKYTEESSDLRFYNPQTVEEKEESIFKITESTSMYNNYGDIPHYMRTILLDSKIRQKELLEAFGFKSIWIEVIERG